MRERFRALPGGAQAGLALLGVVVALNLIAAIGNRLAPSPSGPAGSSYATAPRGVAALAELLDREGHPVERVRPRRATRRSIRTPRCSCSSRTV